MISPCRRHRYRCTPTAWMMMSEPSPNPVPGVGHFNRTLLGHFWRAAKSESTTHSNEGQPLWYSNHNWRRVNEERPVVDPLHDAQTGNLDRRAPKISKKSSTVSCRATVRTMRTLNATCCANPFLASKPTGTWPTRCLAGRRSTKSSTRWPGSGSKIPSSGTADAIIGRGHRGG